jgi:membrane fusion protein (multidrug efflux system)
MLYGLTGCSMQFGDGENGKGGKFAKKDTETKELIVPVEAAYPERGDISSFFETSTRIEAEVKVEIASKSTARCLTVLVDEGDVVEQGAVLAELDKEEAQANYNQSAVQVRQHENTYKLAKRQHDQGLGSKMDMDDAKFMHEQSLATREAQKVQLDNLTIKAPIDGIITARAIQPGMLVSAGTMVYSMMDPESYILAINPPEKELSRLKVGQQAKVTVDAIPGETFNASIRRINPSVDPVSGTIKVVLDFDDMDRSMLRESAFARVKLVMATVKDVILIPKEAIVDDNGQKFVYGLELREKEVKKEAKPSELNLKGLEESIKKEVVEASEETEETVPEKVEEVWTAKRIKIITGLEDNDIVQVYMGLKDDMQIVINGQHSLKDGAGVKITSIQDELEDTASLSADEALAKAKEKREQGGEEESNGGGRRGKF